MGKKKGKKQLQRQGSNPGQLVLQPSGSDLEREDSEDTEVDTPKEGSVSTPIEALKIENERRDSLSTPIDEVKKENEEQNLKMEGKEDNVIDNEGDGQQKMEVKEEEEQKVEMLEVRKEALQIEMEERKEQEIIHQVEEEKKPEPLKEQPVEKPMVEIKPAVLNPPIVVASPEVKMTHSADLPPQRPKSPTNVNVNANVNPNPTPSISQRPKSPTNLNPNPNVNASIHAPVNPAPKSSSASTNPFLSSTSTNNPSHPISSFNPGNVAPAKPPTSGGFPSSSSSGFPSSFSSYNNSNNFGSAKHAGSNFSAFDSGKTPASIPAAPQPAAPSLFGESNSGNLMSGMDVADKIVDLMMVNLGPKGHQVYNIWTVGRLAYNLYQRLTINPVEELKQEFYGNIVKFLQENPKASDAEKEKVIKEQVAVFCVKYKILESENRI